VHTIISKIATFVTNNPRKCIVAFLLACLLPAALIPLTEIEIQSGYLLQSKSKALHTTHQIERHFGGGEFIMLIFSAEDVLKQTTLERIRKISGELEQVKDFEKIVSIFSLKKMQNTDGVMQVTQILSENPTDEAEKKVLVNKLKETSGIQEELLSSDFRHTVVFAHLRPKADGSSAIAKINRIISDNPGPEQVRVGGIPILQSRLSGDTAREVKKFLPLCLLFMLVILLLSTRQIGGGILSFAVICSSLIPAWGMANALGWKLQMITLYFPLMAIAAGAGAGIHIMLRFQEENAPAAGLNNRQLAENTIVSSGLPLLTSAAVATVGFLSMRTYKIEVIEQLGSAAVLGVLFSLAGVLMFLSAWLSILPRPRPAYAFPVFSRILLKASIVIMRHPAILLAVFVFSTALAAWGIAQIQTDTNPENYYRNDKELSETFNIINKNFGGMSSISVLVQGDIKDPAILKRIDDFEKEILRIPAVASTISVAWVVRHMNKTMHNGDENFDSIPDQRESVSDYFMQYSVAGDAGDFNRLVDFSYQNAQIIIRINDASPEVISGISKYVHHYIQRHGAPFVTAGGTSLLFAETAEQITTAQKKSLLITFLISLVLIAIFFRSLRTAVSIIIPPSFSLLAILGICGWLRVAPDASSMLVFHSIYAGGITFSAIYASRFNRETASGATPAEAAGKALYTSGRSVIFSALMLIAGFSVFIFSNFAPLRFSGILLTSAVFAGALYSLLLTPVLCLLFGQRYSVDTEEELIED